MIFIFFSRFGGTVEKDYRCARVAIKCSAHDSRLVFSKLISGFKVRALKSSPTPPTTALTEFFLGIMVF